MTIDRFMNEFHFLSNFSSHEVEYEGIKWRTAEHAYQAMKTLNHNDRLNISEIDLPGDAKRYGRSVRMRVDWDDIKLEVMEDIVRAKFRQNEDLPHMLLATVGVDIEEGNTWKDTYWGIDVFTGEGENHLGKILMKIRDDLQNARPI